MKRCQICGKELQNNEVCSCSYTSWSNLENNKPIYKEKRKNGLNIATSIIYPILMFFVYFALFTNNKLQFIPFIMSLISLVGASIFILLSGSYFIIIPLPIIFLFKFGNQKPELEPAKRVLFTVIAVVLLFWPFIFLAF